MLILTLTIDSVFSFMDTFEERSVGMKTNQSDTDQEITDALTKIDEVSNSLHNDKILVISCDYSY